MAERISRNAAMRTGIDRWIVDAGPTGNKGIIGWYVPPWMAKKYPDITNWKNLNKYADLVQDLRVRRQGPAPRRRPVLRHQRRGAGQEPEAQLQGGRRRQRGRADPELPSAEKNKTALLGYFYEPQWFLSEVTLVKVDLPKYTHGCDADPAKVACDYPPYKLNKIVATKFAESDSPGRTTWSRTSRGPTTTRTWSPRHRRGRDVAGRRRQEVGRRQPGQGRRLAEVALAPTPTESTTTRLPHLDRRGGARLILDVVPHHASSCA